MLPLLRLDRVEFGASDEVDDHRCEQLDDSVATFLIA